eukprot:TRINITY_DN15697_c0_g1_i3.p1 TRINITY_DN15697_c0_g1~~TRINITY_DN15697_c0_g1_i3.p1  ORF type:complete len:207 (+),score=56.09 TRINITY_DN15697_c0_g1_i3:97-717(+)
MIRRPQRSTLSSSSAASDVYKRQVRSFSQAQSHRVEDGGRTANTRSLPGRPKLRRVGNKWVDESGRRVVAAPVKPEIPLLFTPRTSFSDHPVILPRQPETVRRTSRIEEPVALVAQLERPTRAVSLKEQLRDARAELKQRTETLELERAAHQSELGKLREELETLKRADSTLQEERDVLAQVTEELRAAHEQNKEAQHVLQRQADP